MSYYRCSSEKREGCSALEDVVKSVVSQMNKKGILTEEAMMELWKAAAGVRAARHSKPVSFRRSSLVVHVDGSSWLYELTLKKKNILKKLAHKMASLSKGKKKVKEIRLRIGDI